MQVEPEVKRILADYGLKLIEIFRHRPNKYIIEYLISLFSNTARRRFHKAMQGEILNHPKDYDSETHKNVQKWLSTLTEDVLGDLDEYTRKLSSLIFVADPILKNWFLRELKKYLTSVNSRRTSKQKTKISSRSLIGRTDEIGKVFLLSKKEKEILLFLYLKTSLDRVERVFDSSELKMDELLKSAKNYCRFFELTPGQLREILKKDSALVGSGLVSKTRHNNALEVSNHVSSYLAGLSTQDLSGAFFEKDKAELKLKLKDFSIPKMNTEVALALLNTSPLKKGNNILLFGIPGTGKTEYARTLAKSTGAEVFFVKQTDEDGDEDLSHRKTALVAAQNLLQKRNAVLIVDECDPIINTTSGLLFWNETKKKDEKSWINQYIERSKLKIIWISNRVNGIDDSTKRRFSYAQEFTAPERRQRLKAWEIQAKQHSAKFLDQKNMEQFAIQYDVSPGIISLALQDIQAMEPATSKEVKLTRLKNILAQQQVFCIGKKKELAKIASHYALEGLNTDIPLLSVQKSISRFYEKLQNDSSEIEIPNLNVLLLGPPGTGKTEFVKHLSDRVEKELIVKRTSDLLSKYVGESEQNIAEVFREAEQKESILFLDEVDSLFINREGASQSWEISQTNELLCQMENFKGVLVCATNFDKNLDKAVLRRFGYKIKFDYLKPEAKVVFFRRILSPLLKENLTLDEEKRIASIGNLAPGDFKVVYQKNFLKDQTDPGILIEELQSEVLAKQTGNVRPIFALNV